MRRSAIACAGMLAFAISFFPYTPARAAHGDHLVIAEVQIGGTNARDEFVEIYNPTAAAIAFEGWRLAKRTASGNESNLVTAFPALTIAPHASILIAHPDGAFAASADQRYTTQESLANENTIVLFSPLRDGVRPIVDLVGWGTASSREGTAAPNSPSGQSLERKPGGANGNAEDSGDNASDFFIQPQPNPQSAGAAARPEIVAPPPDTSDGGSAPPDAPNADAPNTDDAVIPSAPSPLVEPSPPSIPLPPPTHVRINEFVADPADGDEWIELVNTGSQPVNLADWMIEDGAEMRTLLTGAIGIGEQRFFVIRKPKGQLNNSGDRIVLKDPRGGVVDAVSYGDWNDGKTSDNAPAASDPASVARVTDGADSGNDRLDFVRTETPTPGTANVVASVPAEETIRPALGISPKSATPRPPRAIIVLNELFPNPPGDDQQDETIEVANIGDAAADLVGWRLRDELGAEYVLRVDDGPTVIAAGGFLVIPRTRTGIALNNTGGETVRLFASDAERATSVATFTGDVAEGHAWARGEDGRWSWTTTRTPNAANVLAPPNRTPDAVVDGPTTVDVGAVAAFDASDSADPDREPVAIAWDFGDPSTEADHASGVIGRYAYDHPGTYTVALTVTDARGGTAAAQHRITVRPRAAVAGIKVEADADRAPASSSWSASALLLSELLPNPTGADTDAEWIEIENAGDTSASLAGWTLAMGTADGTTAPRAVALPDSAVVPPHGFLVLPRRAFRAALRNSDAVIAFHRPDGSVADRVTYDTAPEGSSFARDAIGAWAWTAEPTPGQSNAIVRPSANAPRVSRAAAATMMRPDAVALAELRDHELGDLVTVHGTVTAPLGTVGKQIFYVGDSDVGVQVYVGNRAIPPLAVGDRVEVTGELRDVGGERRIGMRSPADVRRTGSGSAIVPDAIRAQDAGADRVGALVAVEGEVVAVQGRNLTIDDGSDELRVVLPASGIPDRITAGDTIRAAGVVSQTRSGFRVLARDASDIERAIRSVPAVPVTAAAPPSFPAVLETTIIGGVALLLLFSLIRQRLVTAALAFVRALRVPRENR